MKKKLIVFILIAILFMIPVGFSVVRRKQTLTAQYNTGFDYYQNKEYDKAISTLEPLGDYRECLKIIADAKYQKEISLQNEKKQEKYNLAEEYYNEGKYDEALSLFNELLDFSDSREKVDLIENIIRKLHSDEETYSKGIKFYTDKQYLQAIELFQVIPEYKDSRQYIDNCNDIINRMNHAHTISAGIRLSAGITDAGNVLIAGNDADQHLRNVLSKWKDMVSVSAYGEFIIGLRQNGTADSVSLTNSYKIDTSEWNDIIAISSGDLFVVALKNDGTVIAQGHNGDGQINIDNWNDVIDIDCGWRHTVALTKDGKILMSGKGADYQLSVINQEQSRWNDIIAISAGGGRNNEEGHTLGLRSDGTVVAVGKNNRGQCNVEKWSDIVAISAGDFHSVGLKKDGTVVSTLEDEDSYKEIEKWSDIVAISAGYGVTFGLKKDGSVLVAGYSTQGQTQAQDWKNIAVYNNVN